MTLYQDKYHKLYKLLKCPLDISIPINDLDAWEQYPKYRFVYNKLYLAEFQNLDTAPFPIKPKKYPVVSKPIINLYGMGLNSFKMENSDDFIDNWYSNNFWCEYLEGEHISYDIILKKGKIKWYYCFQGHYIYKNKKKIHGAFDYWVSCKKPLNDNIKMLLRKFNKYTGVINIECIGDKMIECHLRMGDIDHFAERNILKNIILLYCKNEWKLDKNFVPSKIYLFPVWWRNKDIIKNLNEKKYKKYIKNICSRVLCYTIDNEGSTDPPNMHRVMNLTASSYESGITTREMLYNFMKKIEKNKKSSTQL